MECKTRLHECVTCIEQAEIAVTELEQRNNTEVGGKLDSQREEIKGMSSSIIVLLDLSFTQSCHVI